MKLTQLVLQFIFQVLHSIVPSFGTLRDGVALPLFKTPLRYILCDSYPISKVLISKLSLSHYLRLLNIWPTHNYFKRYNEKWTKENSSILGSIMTF